MDFDTVIKKRKSVRSFKSSSASWKPVLEAIDSALQSPFAGNHNNLKFLIVENPETIAELAKHSKQPWIKESGICVVVCSDDTHLENMYGERERLYSKQQAGAAIQTFLLKLVDLGLSGCWVGAYSDEFIRNAINVPSHIQIEAIIPIGHAKPEKTPRKRRKTELEHSIYWESWEKTRRPSQFEEPLEEEPTQKKKKKRK